MRRSHLTFTERAGRVVDHRRPVAFVGHTEGKGLVMLAQYRVVRDHNGVSPCWGIEFKGPEPDAKVSRLPRPSQRVEGLGRWAKERDAEKAMLSWAVRRVGNTNEPVLVMGPSGAFTIGVGTYPQRDVR